MQTTVANILYINPFAQEISGPDESLLALINKLDRLRFQPHVWIPPHSPYAEAYRQAGAKVIETLTPAIRRSFELPFWWHFICDSWRAGRQLARLIKSENIQLVHTNMEVVLFSGRACKRSKTPSVYHVRGTSFARPRWIGDLLMHFILHHADHVFCISDAVRELFDDPQNKRISTLYNPIDTSVFQPKPLRRDERPTWLQPFAFVVGTAGRINDRKDLQTFVKAAAIVNKSRDDIAFVVVGGTATPQEEFYLKKLQLLSRELAVNQHLFFPGQAKDMRAMAEMYGSIDIACLLSKSEGFGRAIAEAAAMGLPTIGTRVGGIQEIIEDQHSGLLIPPENPQALAHAILQLINEPEKMKKMGRKGRDRVLQHFTLEKHVEAVEATYSRLLKLS